VGDRTKEGAVRIARRELHRGRVLELSVERVRLPNGREMDFELIHHRGAAAVVPLVEPAAGGPEVLLLRQYRYATGGWLLEVPAGTLDGGEEPAACARREVEEETGFRAADVVPLGWIWSSPGFCDEKIWLFLARGLAPSRQRLDDDELIEVERVALAEAVGKAARGEIHDAKSVAALLRAGAHLDVRP
jgi:ADP-ribose pyrophosphatase